MPVRPITLEYGGISVSVSRSGAKRSYVGDVTGARANKTDYRAKELTGALPASDPSKVLLAALTRVHQIGVPVKVVAANSRSPRAPPVVSAVKRGKIVVEGGLKPTHSVRFDPLSVHNAPAYVARKFGGAATALVAASALLSESGHEREAETALDWVDQLARARADSSVRTNRASLYSSGQGLAGRLGGLLHGTRYHGPAKAFRQ